MRLFSTAALAAVAGLTGCQSVNHGFSPIAQGGVPVDAIQTTAVLTPHVVLRSYSAGGLREERDDWNAAARAAVTKYIENLPGNAFVRIDQLENDPEFQDEITEIRDLCRAIELNSLAYRQVLPVQAGMTHSVGSIDHLLEASDADALLVIHGVDDIFTSGRQALVLVGLVASVYLGGFGVVGADGGEAHVSAALIARDGTILWHRMLSHDSISDLRTEDGVGKTLNLLFQSFPLREAREAGES